MKYVENPVDRDVFKFGLEFVNVQLTDSGLYQYGISFLLVETVLRVFTKHFNVVIGEHNIYSYCLFLKDMISGE